MQIDSKKCLNPKIIHKISLNCKTMKPIYHKILLHPFSTPLLSYFPQTLSIFNSLPIVTHNNYVFKKQWWKKQNIVKSDQKSINIYPLSHLLLSGDKLKNNQHCFLLEYCICIKFEVNISNPFKRYWRPLKHRQKIIFTQTVIDIILRHLSNTHFWTLFNQNITATHVCDVEVKLYYFHFKVMSFIYLYFFT